MQAQETRTCLLKTRLTPGHSHCASRRCLPLSARKAGAAEPRGGAGGTTPTSSLPVLSCGTSGAGRGMHPPGSKRETPGLGSISLRRAGAFVRPWAGQGGCAGRSGARSRASPHPLWPQLLQSHQKPRGCLRSSVWLSLQRVPWPSRALPAGLPTHGARTRSRPPPPAGSSSGLEGLRLPNRKGWGWAWV